MERCTCCVTLSCTALLGCFSSFPLKRPTTSRSAVRHDGHWLALVVLLLALTSLESARAFLITSHQPFQQSQWLRPDSISLASTDTDHAQDTDDETVRTRNIRFVSPLLQEGYPRVVQEFQNGTITEKPLLLYLPGFDGTWVAPFLQFPELSTIFDVRCLTMGMDDRSTFEELKEDVIDYIYKQLDISNKPNATNVVEESQDALIPEKRGNFFTNLFGGGKHDSSERSVYLMGESFGGILACEVAIALLKERQFSHLKGLAVINAATCYDRSRFAFEATKLTSLPGVLYPLGLLTILPLFMDDYALPQLILMLQSKALPSIIDSEEREAFMGRVAFGLPQKLQFMPQETLHWRLNEWLAAGCTRVSASRLQELSTQNLKTLVVAGEKDMTLPSIAEAERLSSILPNCHVHVVEGAGHANTCGSRVDLAALMRGRFDELKNRGKRGRRVGRTSMKPQAAKGTGNYFGMEPRYNGKEEGLSPLLYWSKRLWIKPPKEFKEQ